MIFKLNYTKVLLLGLLFTIVYSCVDEVQLLQEDNLDDSFYVDGIVALSNHGSYVEVFANRIFNFSVESRIPLKINNINILNEEEKEITLRKSGNSLFRHDFNDESLFQIKVGEKYKIQLNLTSGELWESEWESIPLTSITPNINQNIIHVESQINSNSVENIELSVDVDIPENNGLLWDTEHVFKLTDSPWPVMQGPDYEASRNVCYIRNKVNLNQISLFDPRTTSQTSIDNFPISTEPANWQFNEGLYYEVRQRTLSYEALDYWIIIKKLLTLGGNIFDERPGGLSVGNINNATNPDQKIFGYFYAVQEEFLRFKASSDIIGERRPYCPWIGEKSDCGIAPGCCWAACCDCRLENNSSIDRPIWWVD